MSSTHERVKKRREYLTMKGAAYIGIAIGLAMIVDWVTKFIRAVTHLSLFWNHLITGRVHSHVFVLLFSMLIFLVGMTAVTIICFGGVVRHLALKAKQLPYVPPVTADTLPAEEVLVRGSEQPTQEQGKVLLRGTDGSGGAGEQELLRSSQGQE